MLLKQREEDIQTQTIICWLTGHTVKSLNEQLKNEVDCDFFSTTPQFNPYRTLITCVICGVRIEEIEEETMREIRYLEKLIDELANGKTMERILRN